MWELRKKLYEEPCPLTNEELDVLKFWDDFSRIYDLLYDNEEIEFIIENETKIDYLELWETILQNKENSEFFKKVYEEHAITIVSDRELETLGIIYNYHAYKNLF